MSVPRQNQYQTGKKNKLFPCTICQRLTDQTCSLCRKVFYCSAQHQQVDWHMKHKMQCEGKIIQNSPPANQQWNTHITEYNTSKERQFFASDTHSIENKSNQIRLENQAKQFIGLFQERLVIRKKCIDKYVKFNETNSIQNSELFSLLEQLSQISANLIHVFKPGFTPILQEIYSITTSKFILKLDEVLDRSLLAKYDLIAQRHEQVRRFLFAAMEQIPFYPKNIDERCRQIYSNVLKAVIKISQAQCNDKVTESLMSKYVIVLQKFDGIWEQVYAYFNMGNWYLKKTYYHKAINCFNHSLQLLNNHKPRQNIQSSTLVKADLIFNISLSHYSLGHSKQAFDFMQQSYRLRVKAVGKNAIQSSQCLQCLAKWAFKNKYWQDCLQYAKQCYRVRKLNINYPTMLQSIQKLLEQIYTELRRQKQKSQQQMSIRPAKYYENLINPVTSSEERTTTLEPQQSFIKQLNASRKQELIAFKIIITPQMAQTYSSNQWQKLTKLLEMTDKLMQKQQIRRIIFQSQFTESLKSQQRDTFIKLNKID